VADEPSPTLDDLIAGTSKTTPPPAEPAAEPVADATPEPAAAATDEPAAETETATDENADADFFSSIKENYGEDLAEKYGSADEALRGLIEASHTVGRRDEDAAYGRAMRQMISGREQQFAAVLAGQTAPQQTAPAKAGTKQREFSEFPADADSWRYQITTNDKGEYVPAPGAPATVVQDYREYVAAKERAVNELLRNSSQFKELPSRVSQEIEQIKGHLAGNAQAEAVRSVQNQYVNALFVNGEVNANGEGVLTADGRKVEQAYIRLSNDPNLQAASQAYLLQTAIEKVLGPQPDKRKGTAIPSARAVRTPGVAVAGKKTYRNLEDELNDRIAQNPDDLDKILTEIHSRLANKQVG
jgi:hypothetical protein